MQLFAVDEGSASVSKAEDIPTRDLIADVQLKHEQENSYSRYINEH
jgi:hypothetical protein